MSDTPAPVEVTNADPISVRVEELEVRPDALAAKVDADKLRTQDQRRISGIWERTQQVIALSVVEATLFVACFKSVQGTIDGQPTTEAGVAFVFLASVANLVIGFYFGRTNHTRVGGDTTPNDAAIGR